jgi:hypothetical protein
MSIQVQGQAQGHIGIWIAQHKGFIISKYGSYLSINNKVMLIFSEIQYLYKEELGHIKFKVKWSLIY